MWDHVVSDFILNAWYCAAWSHEIAVGMIARRLVGIPVVLFRTEDGKVSILHDRCSHRFAPLSKGIFDGRKVVCGYHGLAFDGQGACVGSPFNKTLPPEAKVRSFPTLERWGAVWFWPGDPALVDPSLLPDFDWLDNEPGPHGYLHMKANYQLIIDNLMDLSHIEYVHVQSFGGGGAFFSGEHSTDKVGPNEIWSRWSMPNVEVPMPARGRFKADRVDHWQDMRWSAPSNCLHELGITEIGVPKENIVPKRSAHLLTPETATTTHYFYSIEVSPEPDNGGAALARFAFEEEDRPMIESVQGNMSGDFWAERPVVLATDSSGVLVRRTIDRLLRAEKAALETP